MPVFRLDPIDLTHRDWKRSDHRGPCHVTARDSEAARERAALVFVKASKVEFGATHPLDPWTNPMRVRCTEVHHIGEPPPDGMVEVPEGSGWRSYETDD